jgi:hypothetical protein
MAKQRRRKKAPTRREMLISVATKVRRGVADEVATLLEMHDEAALAGMAWKQTVSREIDRGDRIAADLNHARTELQLDVAIGAALDWLAGGFEKMPAGALPH